jgi:hypothetical protein
MATATSTAATARCCLARIISPLVPHNIARSIARASADRQIGIGGTWMHEFDSDCDRRDESTEIRL